jgi:hypothetical protein
MEVQGCAGDSGGTHSCGMHRGWRNGVDRDVGSQDDEPRRNGGIHTLCSSIRINTPRTYTFCTTYYSSALHGFFYFFKSLFYFYWGVALCWKLKLRGGVGTWGVYISISCFGQ